MKKLLPVILALFGLGIGLGAGLALRPHAAQGETQAGGIDGPAGTGNAETPDTSENEADVPDAHEKKHENASARTVANKDSAATTEFVKLNNQFVVPVVTHGRVSALVILALSVEVSAGDTEEIYAREPKLRDALLQVMFDHANAGGFDGVFTNESNLSDLRHALLEAAMKVMGDMVKDVLISDISRQDS